MPSHYLNQCRHIVNWTHGNKFQWNMSQNTSILTQENQCENVVCDMAAILFWPQCVKQFHSANCWGIFSKIWQFKMSKILRLCRIQQKMMSVQQYIYIWTLYIKKMKKKRYGTWMVRFTDILFKFDISLKKICHCGKFIIYGYTRNCHHLNLEKYLSMQYVHLNNTSLKRCW